jgi:hypothetical protein
MGGQDGFTLRLVAETLIALEVIEQRWRGTGQTERSQAL